jgi:hypothetical protein
MENQNITMIKGDTLSFNCFVYDEFQMPFMVDSAYFSCKKKATGDEYIFRKEIDDGIEQDENGMLTVRVAPEDTAEVDAGEYFYDFEINVGEDVYTIMVGLLSIENDITRR